MAKKKENTSAKHTKKETAEANDPKTVANQSKPSKKGITKVKITGGVAWLGLPYNFGQEVEIGEHLSESQAQELIDNKRAKDIS
jgi:hypothetical protein